MHFKSIVIAAAMLAAMTVGANAHGGGGHDFGGGQRSGPATDRRHGNDSHMKAASRERDKLLDKLKSICRGC